MYGSKKRAEKDLWGEIEKKKPAEIMTPESSWQIGSEKEIEDGGRGITRRANDRRQKSDRDRSGRWSTYCVSYLGLSVLADRIEVFSIYANHSHRHRIITALCQESSPSAQSLHPFLASAPLAIPCSLPFHSSPRNPSLLSSLLHLSSRPSFYPCPSVSLCFIDEHSGRHAALQVEQDSKSLTSDGRSQAQRSADNRWLGIMGGELRKAHSRSL